MISYPELFKYKDESKMPIKIKEIKTLAELIDKDIKTSETGVCVDVAVTGSVYVSVWTKNDEHEFTLRIADHQSGVNGWDVDYDYRTDVKDFKIEHALNAIKEHLLNIN